MRTYNPALINRARAMRREMTPAEKHLWFNCLCHLPIKFRRQRPFGQFIVDFYSPALQLVIEVDGDSHFQAQGLAYDKERTLYLQSLGLTVIRFSNHEVLHQLSGVYETIMQYVSVRGTPPAPPIT